MIALDRRTHVPLQRQVYAAIRSAILEGRLPPGTRLPASRTLADDLGVSRTTVVLAYAHLETEGFITGRGSAGSFVSILALEKVEPRTSRRPPRDAEIDRLTRQAKSVLRSAAGAHRVRPTPVPFRAGEPALDLFPARLWARIYARRARRSGAALLGYGSEHGHRALRAAIAAYVSAARGVTATADQVLLVRGTQQGVHLTSRALLRAGDVAWVEDPGYPMARALLGMAGAALVPVPVDAEGLIVAEGVRKSPTARAAIVSPSHHFPLGATMSLGRRLALLDWAGGAGAWVLEDDYDSEFRYVGAPIPSLQGLDTNDRVIYLGTFSKTVFPALRLGYVIVPPGLVDLFRATQSLTDHVAPSVEQATLAEFIDDGHFTRHVRQMRAAYAERQDALLRGIARELGDLVEAQPVETGMHLVAWLRDRRADDVRISRLAHEAGVEAGALSIYRVEARLPPGLLLGFAAVRPSDMGPALRLLRQAIVAAAR
ncbi:MAG TPA: PLP-dependent aminotransferase family protein [Gemmatimonadaceae bacterium]|nr:PLP-dependent aminotransferase family protein [Gemmatimonadaceae bacterium]